MPAPMKDITLSDQLNILFPNATNGLLVKPSDSRVATTQSTKFKFLDVQSMYAAGSSIEINKQIYVAYFTCSHKKQKTLTAAVDGTIGAGKMVKVKFINNHMKTEIWQ